MSRFGKILLHICVICSFICVIARILDWYNPYMDFSGHVFWARDVLCVGVILLAGMRRHKPLRRKRHVKEGSFTPAKRRYA